MAATQTAVPAHPVAALVTQHVMVLPHLQAVQAVLRVAQAGAQADAVVAVPALVVAGARVHAVRAVPEAAQDPVVAGVLLVVLQVVPDLRNLLTVHHVQIRVAVVAPLIVPNIATVTAKVVVIPVAMTVAKAHVVQPALEIVQDAAWELVRVPVAMTASILAPGRALQAAEL